MADTCKLRVFSLNCWGIRYNLSKHCSQRLSMIAELLSTEQHDIALLQEVWSENDFIYLKKKLACSHPHSYYFRSGVIGSGLAIFSRHRIQDTFLYRYSLNGYPYTVYHGDWYCGKAVGMAILDIGSLKAHVYVTHLHAEYSREKDSYLPHRVVQAWELQQFIRHTSSGADLVILGGDLNMHPQDLGNRLLRTYTGLRDCYMETDKFDGCEDGVTFQADNPFLSKKELATFEKGIRIDYLLMKGSSRVTVQCESMCTTKGSVPGHPYPYSDHEALSVQLSLGPASPPTLQEAQGPASTPTLQGAASPPTLQEAQGPASPPTQQEAQGPASTPTLQGAASPPTQQGGLGPASPPTQQEPASPPTQQEPASPPTQQGAGEQDCDAGELAALVDLVTEARTEVKVGVHCAERTRDTAARTGVMGVALLLLELAMAAVPWMVPGAAQPFPQASFYLLGALCCAILLCSAQLHMVHTMEVKALQGADAHMRLALGSLQERLRGPQPHDPQRRPPDGQGPAAPGAEE